MTADEMRRAGTLVIEIDGDRIRPVRLGAVAIHAATTGNGWHAVAFGPGSDIIARGDGLMPDDAVRVVVERIVDLRDALDLALCECGAVFGVSHPCGALPRMDGAEMMGIEPEPMQ